MELEILMSIQWRLNFATVYYWLGSYLDLLRFHLHPSTISPLRHFTLELLDLAVHTPIVMLFPYSMIVAAALHLRIQDAQLIRKVTPYGAEELIRCGEWLWSLFRCPEGVVYFEPEEHIDGVDFDAAVGTNYRIMNFLMVQPCYYY